MFALIEPAEPHNTTHSAQAKRWPEKRDDKRRSGEKQQRKPEKKASTRTKDEKRFRAKETRARERRLKWSYRERKKKSPIGTSFRRVAISLWTWLLLRRCCLLTFFFFRKIMIHKISSLRFSLCFLFSFSTSSLLLLLTTFRFDRTRRTTTVGASEERYTTSLFRWSALVCGSKSNIYIHVESDNKEWKNEILISGKKGQEEIYFVQFFSSTSSSFSLISAINNNVAQAWMSYGYGWS